MLSIALLAAAVLAPPASASHVAGEDLVPRNVRRSLQRTVTDVAELGEDRAVERFRGVLLTLGDAPGDHAKLAPKWDEALAEAPAVPRARDRQVVARKVERAAAKLADRLDDLDGAARLALARAIAELDAAEERAQRALGHTFEDGVWADAGAHARRRARGAIAALEVAARGLAVPVETAPSANPAARLTSGDGARVASACGLHLHGGVAADKLARVLREGLRALAFGRALLGAELELPTVDPPVHLVLVPTGDDYAAALAEALAEDGIDRDRFDFQQSQRMDSFVDVRGWRTCRWRTEARYQAVALWAVDEHLFGRQVQPCLAGGFLNWLCLRFFGTTMPSVVWRGRPDENETVGAGSRLNDPLWRAASAGLFGCRAWVRARLEQGAPFTYSRAIVDVVGKLGGESLLVATIAAEELLVRGELAGLIESTRGAEDRVRAVEDGLGRDLPTFDAQWIAGLEESERPLGVLQLVRGEGGGDDVDQHTLDALAHLRELRATAFRPLTMRAEPLDAYGELSRSAAAHARYLVQNPDQRTRWPDAHEEYADRPGFSAAGASSGLRSVIAFTGEAVSSIDAWMATFYHRLPLLEPGLCGLGVGIADDVVVLDVGSLCNPWGGTGWVVWPPDAATDVPRRFTPELPNPVPGEDPSTWGFPITVQGYFGEVTAERELTLELFAGTSVDAPPVDGHFISPHAPFFEEHVPLDAWCLIPKAPLARSATYTVRAHCAEIPWTKVWSFETGD